MSGFPISQGIALAAQNSHTNNFPARYRIQGPQWGEDGIIQFLVANLDIKNRTVIEFGIADFRESNCRFLTTVTPFGF
jgi:hypothetical protein